MTALARDRALDGLRGYAILAVVLEHVVIFYGLLPYSPLGCVGVLVFFGLSGYLIAGITWRVEPSVAAYRTFLARRVRRLAPVNLVLVAVVTPVVVVLGGSRPTSLARDVLTSVTQTTAFASALGLDIHPVFGPTWSLTTEWSFYLAFPVLLMLARHRGVGARTAARGAAATGLALYLVALALLDLRSFYLLPAANLGFMCLGAALSLAHRSGWAGPPSLRSGPYAVGSVFLLLVLVLLPGHPISVGYAAAVAPGAVVAALVVIHACRHGHPVGRALGARWLAAVGIRAYSLYLWHTPVLWVLWALTPHLDPWPRAAMALLVVAGVTETSFRVLERPVLAARGRPTPGAAVVGSPRRVTDPCPQRPV